MDVLIAGCGYVGEEVGRQLVRAGHTAWGLKRDVSSLDPEIRPLAADLLDPDLARCLPSAPLIVYAAAPGESTEEGYARIYVDGVHNLLSALVERAIPAERFLLVSSTSVYGDMGGDDVDEGTSPVPDSFRGRFLLEGEEAVLRSGISSVVLRLGGIYGPGRTRMLERVRSGIARCPSGGPVWSNRIHRDDAAGAIIHLLSLQDPQTIYLGVDPAPTPICDVYRELARMLGAPEPGMEGATAMRSRGNKRCSSRRLQQSGYDFRYPSFREGYRAMIESGC